MSDIELRLAEAEVRVDAALIADGLGLIPAEVLPGLRGGQLTARCEQGIGSDAGRFRLTFYRKNRQLRLIIDQDGQILKRSILVSRPDNHSSVPARRR